MHRDPELFVFTAAASLLFGLFALFFDRLLQQLARKRRLKLPHPILVLVFRLWFGALALGALYLTLFGPQGLFPR